MDFFSTSNVLVNIPLWDSVYELSYIEAVGTVAGLLCILLASLEKTINYLFGLINVTLFGVIFFKSNCMLIYFYRYFSLSPIFMVGMRGAEWITSNKRN